MKRWVGCPAVLLGVCACTAQKRVLYPSYSRCMHVTCPRIAEMQCNFPKTLALCPDRASRRRFPCHPVSSSVILPHGHAWCGSRAFMSVLRDARGSSFLSCIDHGDLWREITKHMHARLCNSREDSRAHPSCEECMRNASVVHVA